MIHKLSPLARREAIAFYLCISPWLIGVTVFVIGPMLVSFGLSFTDWNLFTPPVFSGLHNYQQLLDDPLIGQSLKVTLTYTVLYVPTELIGGLALALLMNQRIRGIKIFRAIFYLPSVLSGVAYVIVWMWLLHPQAGLINTVLHWFGIEGPRWLLNPGTALIALWMMSFWGLGRAAVIYLAGLQGVPRELLEAAAIDGAGRVETFVRIVIPMLSPTIFFNLVLGIINTFQTFTSAFVATGGTGSPLDSTLFYVLYLYRQAFVLNSMGYASAMAWLLFLIILVLTLLVVRSASRWVYYEGARNEA
ncbi:MAG TPA: sugar ABC transporter permease [Aggregatilineales bacterium]|nr:sugar ABC transporter permease [Aggregatilineales bacterium]